MDRQRLHILYLGRVQGVGFRYTVKTLATGFTLTGVVKNLPDGRVELTAEGERGELAEFRQAILDSELRRFIKLETVNWSPAINEFRSFEIVR